MNTRRLVLLGMFLWARSAAGQDAGAAETQTLTGIAGVITDQKTGESLIEATVRVLGAERRQALTDVDGKFVLALPPGTYDLRVHYEVYEARRIGNVIVRPGELTRLDVQLSADKDAVQEVVVEAKANRATANALLAERKKSASVSDAISAQEISRSADTNASDAVKRVVSATLADGKYVFVRGLGGRYSSTLLNGAELPSPEPDEQAVPLDMFPTSLLANLTVLKTYSAELPGAFSGGVMQIETNSYPTKLDVRLKISAEYNSASTFRSMNTYRGGRADWLGFDDGTRALPSAVPRDQPVVEGPIDSASVNRIGSSFNNIWSLRSRMAIPNLGINGSVGGVKVIGRRKLGYLVALNFSHRDRIQDAEVNTVVLDGSGGVAVRDTVRNIMGVEQVTAGALVNLGLQLSPSHELNLLSLFTRSTDDRASFAAGFVVPDREFVEGSRMQFIARQLSFTQLRGDHRFSSARNLELAWQANVSTTMRSEPDTRDLEFSVVDGGMRRFRSEPQSGERFFSDMLDLAGGAGAHFTLPLRRVKLRLGASAQTTSRDFGARRFRYVYDGQDPSVLFASPDQLFTPANIGPVFDFQERTLQSDAYRASFTVGGVYALADVVATDKLRLVAGFRYEVAAQRLSPGSRFSITRTPEPGVDRVDGAPLPSFSLVWALSPRMNLRAAYSYTIARPKFRELAPFAFYDFTRRRALSGNPNLRDTHIHNADLRWEMFPDEGSVIAASVFYKRFGDPIEQIIYDPSNGDIGFANQLAAHLVGVEVEARGSFKFLHPKLKDLTAGVNVSYVYSRVDIDPAASGANTSRERPLQGQSPFVVNVNLGWSYEKSGTDILLLYNVYGARIADVGYSGLPDIYEQPFHRLDVSVSQRIAKGFRLKVSGTNIADQSLRFRQGDVTVYRWKPGAAAYAALEWAL